MNCMKLIGLILVFISVQAMGQSLVGKWQVTAQTNCMEKELSDSIKSDDTLLYELPNQSTHSPVVMHFDKDGLAKRIIKITGEKKPAEIKEYRYSFDGTSIHLSDKKSKTILRTYTVETLTDDSLVYSVLGRECEKTTLVRMK